MEHQSPSTSPAEKGTPTDPSRETDGIAALRAGNRVSGQGRSIEKMEHVTKNNFHRIVSPWFYRPRQLQARTQSPLHCPPKKVAQGWGGENSVEGGGSKFSRNRSQTHDSPSQPHPCLGWKTPSIESVIRSDTCRVRSGRRYAGG